jgi:hydrogenase maturation protease
MIDSSKPLLVIGLGNPHAGDDAVGLHLARRLRDHPALPATAEVIDGGTDLLRLEEEMERREHVFLVDALLEEGEPGRLLRFDGDLHELDDHGGSAHHLSPVQALGLLRCLYPTLRDVPITFLGVTITGVVISPVLSAALGGRLEGLVDELLAMLDGVAGRPEDRSAPASTGRPLSARPDMPISGSRTTQRGP